MMNAAPRSGIFLVIFFMFLKNSIEISSMASFELLNNKTHQDLRIATGFPEDVNCHGTVMILPCEIQEVQREYPIIFRKHNQSGHFFPCALLGFEQKENLYLDEAGHWQSVYKPLSVAKGPFLIGLDRNEDLEKQKPLVYVDIDDPRVGRAEGERVFNDAGELTPYMASVSNALRILHEKSREIPQMVEAFTALGLIEPVNIKLDFSSGEKVNFSGAYTIDIEKLQNLKSDELLSLNKEGFLSGAFYIAGSLNNISKLLTLKNNQ